MLKIEVYRILNIWTSLITQLYKICVYTPYTYNLMMIINYFSMNCNAPHSSKCLYGALFALLNAIKMIHCFIARWKYVQSKQTTNWKYDKLRSKRYRLSLQINQYFCYLYFQIVGRQVQVLFTFLNFIIYFQPFPTETS